MDCQDIKQIESIAHNPEAPDILILQEVRGEESCRYLSGSLGLPFWVFSFYPAGIDGLAVISRYPVKILKSFRFNRYGALAVEAVVGSEKTLICSVHLERIKGIGISETGVNISFYQAFEFMQDEISMETDRTRAVAELLSWISSQEYEHIILAGDFNTIPISQTIRKTLNRYQDCLWPGMDYLSGTYNYLPWPLTPRIDYIFHSPNLKCIRAFVVKESAGDHYPVRAVFVREGVKG
jgi:endonuclease/exonuclease/phosphatase family metal-dependent hydrolase